MSNPDFAAFAADQYGDDEDADTSGRGGSGCASTCENSEDEDWKSWTNLEIDYKDNTDYLAMFDHTEDVESSEEDMDGDDDDIFAPQRSSDIDMKTIDNVFCSKQAPDIHVIDNEKDIRMSVDQMIKFIFSIVVFLSTVSDGSEVERLVRSSFVIAVCNSKVPYRILTKALSCSNQTISKAKSHATDGLIQFAKRRGWCSVGEQSLAMAKTFWHESTSPSPFKRHVARHRVRTVKLKSNKQKTEYISHPKHFLNGTAKQLYEEFCIAFPLHVMSYSKFLQGSYSTIFM